MAEVSKTVEDATTLGTRQIVVRSRLSLRGAAKLGTVWLQAEKTPFAVVIEDGEGGRRTFRLCSSGDN